MRDEDCPFCGLAPDRVLFGNDFAVAIPDAYPVSPGHTLVLPRRHAQSFFGICREERDAVFDLLASARTALDASHRPNGYNIGINEGAAAGQTVRHLHVHLIPRYRGDRPDPRGGIRWLIPERADYWSR